MSVHCQQAGINFYTDADHGHDNSAIPDALGQLLHDRCGDLRRHSWQRPGKEVNKALLK